MSRAWSGTPH